MENRRRWFEWTTLVQKGDGPKIYLYRFSNGVDSVAVGSVEDLGDDDERGRWESQRIMNSNPQIRDIRKGFFDDLEEAKQWVEKWMEKRVEDDLVNDFWNDLERRSRQI